MANQCENLLRDLSEDLFDSDEKKDLFRDLERAAKSNRGRDAIDDLTKRIMESTEDRINSIKRKKFISIIKVHDGLDRIENSNQKAKALEAMCTGTVTNVKGARISVTGLSKTWHHRLLNKLDSYLESHDKENQQGVHYDYMMDENNTNDLLKALDAEYSGEFDQGVPIIARTVAKIWRDFTDEMVDIQNSKGANIKKLKDFLATHTWDIKRMRDAAQTKEEREALRDKLIEKGVKKENLNRAMDDIARQRFIDFHVPLIDAERSFNQGSDIPLSEKEVRDILSRVYSNMFGSRKIKDDLITKHYGSGIGSRGESQRVIHFKDIESWSKSNEVYGSGTIQQSMKDTIAASGKNMGRLEVFGPLSDKVYETIKQRTKNEALDPKSPNRDADLPNKLDKVDKFFNAALGLDSANSSKSLGVEILQGARQVVQFSRLGFTPVSTLGDIGGVYSRLVSYGMSPGTVVRHIAKSAFLGATRDTGRALAKIMGVVGHDAIGVFANKFIDVGDSLGRLSKLGEKFFKWTGQEGMDKWIRSMFNSSMSKWLYLNLGKKHGSLDEFFSNSLKRYGIEEKEWELIRSNRDAMKGFKGEGYVTPDTVSQYSHESIDSYLGKKGTKNQREAVLDDLETKLTSYFLDQADNIQLNPDLSERTYIFGSTKEGSMQREVLKVMMQFRWFGLSNARRIIGSAFLEGNDSSLISAIKGRNYNTKFLLNLMASGMVLGGLSTYAKTFLKHGYFPNPKHVWREVMAAPMGIYGDYLLANYSQFGFGQRLLPPAASLATDAVKIFSAATDFDDNGKRLNYTRRVLKSMADFTKNNIIPDSIYTHAPVNYAWNHFVMNSIDPGYTARLTNKIDKQSKDGLKIF
jgi:hypothetical protein